jgi:hypothetical protein
MLEIVLSTGVKAYEGIEPSVCRSHAPFVEAKVPFSTHCGGVPSAFGCNVFTV